VDGRVPLQRRVSSLLPRASPWPGVTPGANTLKLALGLPSIVTAMVWPARAAIV